MKQLSLFEMTQQPKNVFNDMYKLNYQYFWKFRKSYLVRSLPDLQFQLQRLKKIYHGDIIKADVSLLEFIIDSYDYINELKENLTMEEQNANINS